LNQGSCVFKGNVSASLEEYQKILYGVDSNISEEHARKDIWNESRFHAGAVRTLSWVSTHAADGTPTRQFSTGQPVRIRVGFREAQQSKGYIAILVFNSLGDCVAYIHSTHDGKDVVISGDGCIECTIEDLRLGEGTYRLMVDYGSTLGQVGTSISKDCVADAGQIEVLLNGFVKGVGLGYRDGAAHRSSWQLLSHQDGLHESPSQRAIGVEVE
jgi:lipopolysaccharide transport system ATP-binding protein